MSVPAVSQPPIVLGNRPVLNKVAVLTKQGRLERKKSRWFALLFCSICFEGLGRKYLSFIPGEAFYFLKDIVLIYGLVTFPMNPRVKQVMKVLFHPFDKILGLAIAVSLLEAINTGLRESFVLGILGLRAYWLWWIAVPVVANVVLTPTVRRRGMVAMAWVSAVVAIFAMVQFGSPATSATNTYAVQAGNEVAAFEVGSTGRARVSSTFTFITGFTNFVVLVPPLLLSLGLADPNRRARTIATTTAMLSAAALPMSGSRAPFVVGLALLALVAQQAGFLFTAVGRRVIIGGTLAIMMVLYIFPDSLQGVMDRFDSDDTRDRFEEIYTLFPPYSLAKLNYPVLGLGTGMQQNFRILFGVGFGEYESEMEVGRYLIELGAVGYILIWLVRFGLLVALLRAANFFRRARRRAATGAALAYALLNFYGNLSFDHIWQALYFTGCGFILSELVQIWPLLHPSPSRVPLKSRLPEPTSKGA
ncbi:MAG TPA: hypothetical protein VH374_04560 [Polyangia bacterium]|jgi:hypothetical protein|nr:hypothetical protein [Polyangia bacterium]